MNPLREAVRDYLALRRDLGFKLRDHEVDLRDFIQFLERQCTSYITTALALRWATERSHQQPAQWAKRLSFVRGFARHWSASDPRTEIPPAGLLPYRPQRVRPYLYSDEEIQCLLEATKHLPSINGLRPWTYRCLFGLLVVTGMRISEVLSLHRQDVDLQEGLLTIRQSKFGKSRLVPMHVSTQQVLADYAHRRDRLLPVVRTQCFLVSDRGCSLDGATVRKFFYKLSRQTGLRGESDRKGPRLHDFRHRFAVKTLLQWYRSGEDVERRLPILSTYLGHRHVSDTYWYLSTCPELMGLAVERLEQRWEGGS